MAKTTTKSAKGKGTAKKETGKLTRLQAQKMHEEGKSDEEIGKMYKLKARAVWKLRNKGR